MRKATETEMHTLLNFKDTKMEEKYFNNKWFHQEITEENN
jgi:hypothetical protein